MTDIVTRLTGDTGAARMLKGIYSVCSAHPWVIETGMLQALEGGTPLLIESPSN